MCHNRLRHNQPSHAPSRLQFRDKFYPSHIEVSKSHFAAVHESGIGPFEKSRPDGLVSEFEGRPDLWGHGISVAIE